MRVTKIQYLLKEYGEQYTRTYAPVYSTKPHPSENGFDENWRDDE
jgi:hypothetical protein